MIFCFYFIFFTFFNNFCTEQVSAHSRTKLSLHSGSEGRNETLFVKSQFKNVKSPSDYSNEALQISKGKKACQTIDGPGKGEPCIFPFTFKLTGKKYNSCTKDGDNGMKGYWCSTKVDSDGAHEAGKFGYCSEECPEVDHENIGKKACFTNEPGIECKIPFSYRGYMYQGCIRTDVTLGEEYWCPVKDPNEKSGFRIVPCTESCPKDNILATVKLPALEILATLKIKPKVFSMIEGNETCDDGVTFANMSKVSGRAKLILSQAVAMNSIWPRFDSPKTVKSCPYY